MSEKYKSIKISAGSYKLLEEVRTVELFKAVMIKDLIEVAWPRCPACGGPLVRKVTGGVFCAKCGKEYNLS